VAVDPKQPVRAVAARRDLYARLAVALRAHAANEDRKDNNPWCFARPVKQAWFWTPRWQEMEAEADADLAAVRVTVYDSDKAFLNAISGPCRRYDARYDETPAG
jgi:hypothetical protein